jgi:hypothetical protein
MDTQLGTIRLKSFIDVYMLLQHVHAAMDWETFLTARKAEGLFAISINVIDLVLGILHCHDDFGRLTTLLDRHREFVKYHNVIDQLKLLNSSDFPLRNKIWAFGLYNAPWITSACWWLASLQVKFTVYRLALPKPLRRFRQ